MAQPPRGVAEYAAAKPYAGFWRRFLAFAIDGLLLLVGGYVVINVIFFFALVAIISSGQDEEDPTMTLGVWAAALVILTVLFWLYHAGLESSSWRATIGKRLLGLVVADRSDDRVSFGQATGRYFGKLLSALPLGAGFVLAAFMPRKQALHDILADTLVLRRQHIPSVPSARHPAATQPGGASEARGA